MSSVEEASPSCGRSSTSLDDDDSIVLHEKYIIVDGDRYPKWSSGDCEETTLAPADQAITDYVLELLWNSRRNRGALEKTEKGPTTTIEIESAEYSKTTFRGTWGHSPGQLSSLARSLAAARRNRRALRQSQRLRYWYDASSVDCADKILLELGCRLRGSLVPIALALDRADRGELREATRPLFRATTLRIENGSATRRRYYGNDDEVSPRMDYSAVIPQPKRNEKPVQEAKKKSTTRIDRFGVCSRSLIRKLRKRISMITLKEIDETIMRGSVVCKETALCTIGT